MPYISDILIELSQGEPLRSKQTSKAKQAVLRRKNCRKKVEKTSEKQLTSMNQCDILDELSERKLFRRSRERKVPLRENEVQKTSKKILKNF